MRHVLLVLVLADEGRTMTEQQVELKVDRSRCVLCGGRNDCVMERQARGESIDDPCWCVDRTFPEALTKDASERDGGASCICLACLEAGAVS